MVTCIPKKKKEGRGHDKQLPHEQIVLRNKLYKGKENFFLTDI